MNTFLLKLQQRSTLTLIVLAIVVYLFFPTFINPLIKFCDILFGKWPNKDIGRSLIFIFLFFAGVICFFKKINSRKYPTFNSVFFFILFYFLYFLLFRFNSDLNYLRLFNISISIPIYTSKFILHTPVFIADLFFLTLFLFFTQHEYKGEHLEKGKLSLIEDTPENLGEYRDLLNRESFAYEIAKIINETVPQKAISIGILAEWGNGKTVFLNYIKNALDPKRQENKHNIIIEFNPWKVEGEKKTLELFFEILESKLDSYESGITKQFNNYRHKLLKAEGDGNFFLNAAKLFLSIFVTPEESLEKQYNKINESIVRIGKRIIVFVDDLDRLTSNELADIMRLIRNTVDFSNIIFVAAFDKNYVTNSLLGNDKNIIVNHSYLEKIFQLEISLPPLRPEIIKDYFLICFKDIFSNESPNLEKMEFESVINILAFNKSDISYTLFNLGSQHTFLEKFLKNLRDVKRFANSFRLTYKLTYGEVDLYNILLLELIKFKYLSVYVMLSRRELLKNDGKFQVLDDTKFNDLYNNSSKLLELCLDENSKELLKQTIEAIYRKDDGAGIRAAVYPKNHFMYFNYQRFSDTLSLNEFNKTKSEGYEALKELIKKYSYSKPWLNNYLEVLLDLNDFSDVNEYQNLLKSIVFCGEYLEFEGIKLYLISFLKKGKIFNEDNVLSNFFKEAILENNEFKVELRTDILFVNLYEYMYGRNTEFDLLDKETLIQINYNNYDQFLKENQKNEELAYELLLKNWLSVDYSTRKITLNPKACGLFKKYLNNHNALYLKYIIRPATIPVQGFWEYTFEPFLLQIFGSYEEFKAFISDKTNGECKKYIEEKFTEFENNNYQPIIIKDFDNEYPCNKQ